MITPAFITLTEQGTGVLLSVAVANVTMIRPLTPGSEIWFAGGTYIRVEEERARVLGAMGLVLD